MRQTAIATAEQLPCVPKAVAVQRKYIVDIISSGGFVGIAGGCSLTEELSIIRDEGNQLADLQAITDGLATGQRLNPWKKRSPVPEGEPEPYAGLETKDPELAYSIIDEQARAHGSVALEVGLPHHLKYIDRASVIWWGARSDDMELLELIAMHDPTVVLGIKNSLSGDLRPTLDTIASVNEKRQSMAERLGIIVAPALLIYRGSDTARTPTEWKEERMLAFEATEGEMMDDAAHGTMRAHNPGGDYDAKTVEGQEEGWNSMIELAEEGHASKGAFTEASDTRSDVDLHMRFAHGLANIKRMHSVKIAGRAAVAA